MRAGFAGIAVSYCDFSDHEFFMTKFVSTKFVNTFYSTFTEIHQFPFSAEE